MTEYLNKDPETIEQEDSCNLSISPEKSGELYLFLDNSKDDKEIAAISKSIIVERPL